MLSHQAAFENLAGTGTGGDLNRAVHRDLRHSGEYRVSFFLGFAFEAACAFVVHAGAIFLLAVFIFALFSLLPLLFFAISVGSALSFERKGELDLNVR